MEGTVRVQLKKPWQGQPKDAWVELPEETVKELAAQGIVAWVPPTSDGK